MNKELKDKFLLELKDANTIDDMNLIKVQYFGKNGQITGLMKNIKDVVDKSAYGKEVNVLKEELYQEYSIKEKQLLDIKELETLKKEAIDITLPGRDKQIVKQNILIKTAREIEIFFQNMGFEIAIGAEVEEDYYNFEALNLDENHPARDMQDSFFISPQLLLRTHTSNIQSRVLEENKNKDLKIICPGKVYRRDDDDATHSHQFMQIEGLAITSIDNVSSVSMKSLKNILELFIKDIFNNDDLKIRMRTSYFPFTEPSVEVDVTCSNCLGKGCSICKKTGYIEVLGAGIINKKVLSIAGYDENKYVGYAFGIGVERIAMLKYNIEDIRNIYTNDLRFINQF